MEATAPGSLTTRRCPPQDEFKRLAQGRAQAAQLSEKKILILERALVRPPFRPQFPFLDFHASNAR